MLPPVCRPYLFYKPCSSTSNWKQILVDMKRPIFIVLHWMGFIVRYHYCRAGSREQGNTCLGVAVRTHRFMTLLALLFCCSSKRSTYAPGGKLDTSILPSAGNGCLSKTAPAIVQIETMPSLTGSVRRTSI